MPKDDQSELFYHVDENDQVIGSVTRGEAHADKTIIHRAVDIIIHNPQSNSYLFQKRSMQKDKNPGWWTISASGHVTYGQNWLEAAKRELQEEIGLEVELTERAKYMVYGKTETETCRLYIGEYTGNEFKLDPHEVDEVAWVPKEYIHKFLDKEKVTPWGIRALKEAKII